MNTLFFDGTDFEQLLSFINAQDTELKIKLTTENVKLGKVTYTDNDNADNVEVVLVGIDGKGLTGEVTFKYKRPTVSQVYTDISLYFSFKPAKLGDVVSLGDYLPGTNLPLITKNTPVADTIYYDAAKDNLIYRNPNAIPLNVFL